MEESVYAKGALTQLPKHVREKKEVQLELNLAEIMESLGDSLIDKAFEASQLRRLGTEQRPWRNVLSRAS